MSFWSKKTLRGRIKRIGDFDLIIQ